MVKKSKNNQQSTILSHDVKYPIWFSVSESARIGGVSPKTIRRAIQSEKLMYKIVKNRYQINLSTLIKFLYNNTKLRNKLISDGLGQYIAKWRE